MRNLLKYPLFVLCLVLASSVSAQTETPFEKKLFKEQKEGFKAAMNHIANGNKLFLNPVYPNPRAAVVHYLKANEFNPNSSELNFRIALCYLAIDKYKMKKYAEHAYKLKPSVDPKISFLIAESYHIESNWRTAQQYYNIFIQKATNPNLRQLKVSWSVNKVKSWKKIRHEFGSTIVVR